MEKEDKFELELDGGCITTSGKIVCDGNGTISVYDGVDKIQVDTSQEEYIYMTKREYSELKARVDELEKRINKLTICSEVEKL